MKTQINKIKTAVMKAIKDREFTVKKITIDDYIYINVCGLEMAIKYLPDNNMAYLSDIGCDFSFEVKDKEEKEILLNVAFEAYEKVRVERIEKQIENLKKQLS